MLQLPPPFTPDLKVLVLAGTKELPANVGGEPLASPQAEVPLEGKAFLELRGRLVIEYVLDLLEELGLRHVWVLGPAACLARIPSHYDFHPLEQEPGASLARNLLAAVSAVDLQADEPTLTIFGDHPLITSTALLDFLTLSAPHLDEADYFHGLALEEAYVAYSEYFQRTSVHMREAAGRVTGLNIVFPLRLHRLPAFDHIYSVRKLERVGRFLSMLAREMYLLGGSAPGAIAASTLLYFAKEFEKVSRRQGHIGRFGKAAVGWLRRRVPVARIERYAARLLGAERGVKVVPLPHGGTAIDVDFAEELQTIEQNWEELLALGREQDAASRVS